MKKKLSKDCVVCGRKIERRKKWEKNWEEIKYCSDRCRGARTVNHNHESEILALLAERASDKTICPSEVFERYR